MRENEKEKIYVASIQVYTTLSKVLLYKKQEKNGIVTGERNRLSRLLPFIFSGRNNSMFTVC